jgi:exosome complex component RRP42
MATRGALYNTRLAKVSVESTDGAYDFEVADEETEILVGRDDVPISVTVFNIDNVLVLDASPLEELCASACVSVLVNRQGLICGIQKGLKKPIEPSVLTSMLQTGQSKALENLEQLNEHLFKEEKRQLNDEEPIGFR